MRAVAIVLAVFAGYLAGALMTASIVSPFGPAFFFPSAGVTVAAMMLTRRTLWPGIAAAAYIAELGVGVFFGHPVPMAAGLAVANAVEPLIGASAALAWCPGPPDLRRRRDFVAFVLGGCMLGPACGGLIGGALIARPFGTAIAGEALRGWSGDALGVLLVAAPILLWTRQSAVVRRRLGEAAAVLVAAAVGTLVAFRLSLPPATLILPVLAWAAMRLSMLGVALAGAVVALQANVMTTRGFGVVNSMGLSASGDLLLTQVTVAVLVLVSLLIAQEAGGRAEAVRSFGEERARAGVLRSAAHPVAPGRIAGMEVGTCYLPSDVAGGLGGDWYDVMALPGGRTYLAVGDVVGHGMAAVEDMAQLRGAGRAFAHQGFEPGALLAAVNDFSAAVIRGDFATSGVGVYHGPTRTLSYSSAGHPPALLRRAASGEVIRLSGVGGPPLGPLPGADYPQGSVAVAVGDVLVMYTDGLVECGDMAITTGIERLQKLVGEWPPERLLDCDAVVGALVPPPCEDDVCLVVVRFGEGA